MFIQAQGKHNQYIIHTLSIVADLANIKYEQNTDFHLRLFIIILYRMFPSQKRNSFQKSSNQYGYFSTTIRSNTW